MNITQVLLVSILTLTLNASIFQVSRTPGYIQGRELYLKWLQHQKRNLSTTRGDFEYRLQVFLDNLRFIEAHNQLKSSMSMGINQFADLTSEEFLSTYTSSPRQAKSSANRHKKLDPLSSWKVARRVNWAEKEGVLLAPDNQFGCGCSYAFAAAAAAQAAYAIFIDPDTKQIFSKQILVNCGQMLPYDMHGCEGGSSIGAFQFFKDFGIYSQNDLPFTGEEGHCSLNYPLIARLMDFKVINPNVQDLVAAIEVSPVAVQMELMESYQFYEGGIVDIKAPCGFYLNHTALAIGYDLDAEVPYILFQNSFGTEWGEKGYFKYALNSGSSNGMCGIANDANAQPIF